MSLFGPSSSRGFSGFNSGGSKDRSTGLPAMHFSEADDVEKIIMPTRRWRFNHAKKVPLPEVVEILKDFINRNKLVSYCTAPVIKEDDREKRKYISIDCNSRVARILSQCQDIHSVNPLETLPFPEKGKKKR